MTWTALDFYETFWNYSFHMFSHIKFQVKRCRLKAGFYRRWIFFKNCKWPSTMYSTTENPCSDATCFWFLRGCPITNINYMSTPPRFWICYIINTIVFSTKAKCTWMLQVTALSVSLFEMYTSPIILHFSTLALSIPSPTFRCAYRQRIKLATLVMATFPSYRNGGIKREIIIHWKNWWSWQWVKLM